MKNLKLRSEKFAMAYQKAVAEGKTLVSPTFYGDLFRYKGRNYAVTSGTPDGLFEAIRVSNASLAGKL